MAKQLLKASALGLIAAVAGSIPTAFAQDVTLDGRTGVVSTAVPFLRISPDARSGAMGEVGIALSPDANAQHWNVGKIAASENEYGASLTYTPWLRDLVPDINLLYLAGYAKLGAKKDQAISASLRYFSLGEIGYTNIIGENLGTGKPTEMALDMGYSRMLSPEFSVGINLRYIYSNIAAGSIDNSTPYNPANAFGADLGFYYAKSKELGDYQSETWAAGLVLSNLGSKITYTETERDFLPSQLGIGAAYTRQVDMYSKFTFGVDLQKSTTPAPIEKIVVTGGDTTYRWDRQNNKSVIDGFFSSFAKAPPGYGTSVSLGAEYWYQNQFAARAGYFYEAEGNGGRQYFTVGLGVKYSVFGLNFAYLVPSGNVATRNPMANTLRFSLLFDFDQQAIKQAKRKKRAKSKANEERVAPQSAPVSR